MKEIRMVVLGLVVVLLIALVMAGQTAVNRVADYRELTAAKSLHQLTLEAVSYTHLTLPTSDLV